MITAGIKETKNNLSRYLDLVKAGEEVVITDRGKAVARIVKEGTRKQAIRSALEALINRGAVTLPTRDLNRPGPKPIAVPGKPVSEMVIEDRR